MTVIGTSALRAALALLALAAAQAADDDGANTALDDDRAGKGAVWQEVAVVGDPPAAPAVPACVARLDAGGKGMCRN